MDEIDFSLAEQAARPQYFASEEFTFRFLDAAHTGEPIPLTQSIPNTTKVAADFAFAADRLNWFADNKSKLENEFHTGLVERIGDTKARAFIDLLNQFWFDGRSSRTKGRILDLTRSVASYARMVAKPGVQLVANDALEVGAELLSPEEVASVLGLNQQMLHWAIDDWIASRPNSETLSRDDVYVVRGISLATSPAESKRFQELNYIASYSLAISVGEQFSQTNKGTPTLIHTPIDTFADRTLFFAPFVPEMTPNQFELGIIPGADLDTLNFQQHRSGADEFLLGEMPF